MLTFLVFAGTLLVLVGVHEAGHFLAAKLSGVYVMEFAIGFGPKLFSFGRGETRYSLRLIPFGGYVRMAGEDREETSPEIPTSRLLTSKPPLIRILISLSGPAANLFTTFLVAILALWVLGTLSLQVEDVIPTMPAAGVLQPGDVILSIDGRAVYTADALTNVIQRSQGAPVDFLVRRDGEMKTLVITPQWDSTEARYLVGAYFWPIAYTNELVSLAPGSPFAQAGLEPGDQLVAVNGETMNTMIAIAQYMAAALPAESLTLTVVREDQQVAIVLPTLGLGVDEILSGVTFSDLGVVSRHPDFFDGLVLGAGQFADDVRMMAQWFQALLAGHVSPRESVAGPIGIAHLLGEGIRYGPSVFFRLFSYLSLSLGLLNLIPFPALDGSRAAFALYELLRGKPIPPKREGLIHLIGALILIALMLLVTYQDILRLFG